MRKYNTLIALRGELYNVFAFIVKEKRESRAPPYEINLVLYQVVSVKVWKDR